MTEEYVRCIKSWGTLKARWIEAELRDAVVAFVVHWSEKTEIPVKRFLKWLGVAPGKYHDWKARNGEANRHNGLQPRHFWLLEWERKAIVVFAIAHPMEGYRRLAFMMLDADVVAASPSSVYRVLKAAGRLQSQTQTQAVKATASKVRYGLISTGTKPSIPNVFALKARFLWMMRGNW